MTIRSATPEDAPAIAQVQVQAWRETYAGRMPEAFLDAMTGEERRERAALGWARAAADGRQVLLVHEGAGEVVGFVAGGPARDLPEPSGELHALYLLASVQGQGAGRALVRELARRLGVGALGHPDLRLWVLRENPARQFYAHLGGAVTGEKTVTVAGGVLTEVAYGWPDIGALQ